jgi:hypothetical protein
MNNPSANDPKKIWQSQETEKIIMSSQQIEESMQKLHGRSRRTNAALTAVFASIGLYYGLQAAEAPDLLRMSADALISLGNINWAYVAVMAFRSIRPAGLAPDEPLQTSLQFYRGILGRTFEQVRSSNRRVLKGAVPVLLGFVLRGFQSAQESIPSVDAGTSLKMLVQRLGVPAWLIAWLPFVLIIASWGVLKVYGRMISTHWIKHEIERVDQIN